MMSERFRNRYVIHEESGHPGYREVAVLGTKEDLAQLGTSLLEEAKKEEVSLTVYATLEHGQSSRVSLSFRSRPDREIEFLHTVPWKHRLLSKLRGFVLLLLVILAVIGIRSLIK